MACPKLMHPATPNTLLPPLAASRTSRDSMRVSPRSAGKHLSRDRRRSAAEGLVRSAERSQEPQAPPQTYLLNPGIREVCFKTQAGGWLGIHKRFSQDCYFDVVKDSHRVFGVCDGHGSQGHNVARFLSERVPVVLHRIMSRNPYMKPSDALKSAYKKCTKLLRTTTIDASQSGSTCLTLLQTKHGIAWANVGDSRAVIGWTIDGVWSAHQLTNDHRIDDPYETDNSGHEKLSKKAQLYYTSTRRTVNKSVPGFTLTRSLGDHIVSHMGVISTPTTELFIPSSSDKFIVMGTKGLWEVMTNIEAVRFIGEGYEKDPQGVVDTLAEEAQRRWREMGNREEDVTVGLAVIKKT